MKGTAMSNAIVTRQGAPSKSGEVVDTSAAKVVPPSSEVKAEDGKRERVPDLTKALETGKLEVAVRKPAAKKGSTKAKPAAKRSTGNGSGPATRITAEWLSAKKKDVMVKDEVTTADGVKLTIVGRWTRRAKDESLTPMVTGRIVSGAPDGKKKGDRHNSAASQVTHTK